MLVADSELGQPLVGQIKWKSQVSATADLGKLISLTAPSSLAGSAPRPSSPVVAVARMFAERLRRCLRRVRKSVPLESQASLAELEGAGVGRAAKVQQVGLMDGGRPANGRLRSPEAA